MGKDVMLISGLPMTTPVYRQNMLGQRPMFQILNTMMSSQLRLASQGFLYQVTK